MASQRLRSAGRPTLDQVAARAGVGRGTVSRVVNGSTQVSARARAAVERAIAELAYVPNPAARALVTQRSDALALVVSESPERAFSETFLAGMIRGITLGLARTPLQLWLAIARSAAECEWVQRHLTPQHVDGVVLLCLCPDDPLPGLLAQRRLPVVVSGRPARHTAAMGVPVAIGQAGERVAPGEQTTLGERAPPGEQTMLGEQTMPMPGELVWRVDADDVGGARAAVAHLLGRGRTRVAAIAGPPGVSAAVARLAGYHQALLDAGLAADESWICFGDLCEASGARAMRTLLDRHPDLDAVFAVDDLMAVGAMRVLRDHGRRIPHDVSLVGYEDSALAAQTDPPLTTVRQPVQAMGREMARLMVAHLNGGPAESVVLDTHLVIRASA